MSKSDENKRRVPKLRFPGFTEDWEQRKVSELCSISTGKSNTQDKVEDGEYPFYVRSAIIERSNKYLYDEEAVLTVGDGVGTGKVFHYVSGKYDLHQRCYRMYDFTDELNVHYFYHTFSKLFYKRVMAMTAKTSVDSVRLEMIADMEIPCPKIKEQEKIGQYLDNLDNLITLHQRKCDRLKELKKGLLQKMFPKNGEKIPELRFSGFTEDWEQRKFSDFAQRESLFQMSSYDCPSVEYEDVIAEEGCLNKDIRLKEVQKTGIKFDGTQVLYGKLRPYLHNWLNPDFIGVAVGDWWVLRPVEIDKNFLYRLIQTKKFDNVANQSSGSKMPRADWNLVSQSEFIVPISLEEQCRIAEAFEGLDHLITLHQRKLDHLKELKKGLLQQMFV